MRALSCAAPLSTPHRLGSPKQLAHPGRQVHRRVHRTARLDRDAASTQFDLDGVFVRRPLHGRRDGHWCVFRTKNASNSDSNPPPFPIRSRRSVPPRSPPKRPVGGVRRKQRSRQLCGAKGPFYVKFRLVRGSCRSKRADRRPGPDPLLSSAQIRYDERHQGAQRRNSLSYSNRLVRGIGRVAANVGGRREPPLDRVGDERRVLTPNRPLSERTWQANDHTHRTVRQTVGARLIRWCPSFPPATRACSIYE